MPLQFPLPTGLRPFAVEQFRGLNLTQDVEEVGFNGAINILNADFDRRGAVRQRDGFQRIIAGSSGWSTLANYFTGTYNHLVVGEGTNTAKAYTAAGSLLGTKTFANAAYTIGMAQFGTPSSSWMYVGNGKGEVSRWTGTAWETPTAVLLGGLNGPMPRGGLLGVTPWDNRLIVTGFSDVGGGPGSGTQSSPGHVWFSEPGLADTYGVNNYVILRPGDGEAITAVCSWQNYVFIFKESCFFVFYGTSTDPDGNPIFDFRTVDGVGHAWSGSSLSPQSVVAARDGVYFANANGIYRTTGGAAEEVSQAIRPLFRRSDAGRGPLADQAPYLGGIDAFGWAEAMATHHERVLISYRTKNGASPATLLFDPQTGDWSVWDCKPGGFAQFTSGEVSYLYFTDHDIGTTTGYGIFRVDPSTTSDHGSTSVPWLWQSGFSDLGEPAVEKTVRETEIVGSGNVQFTWARDFGNVDTPLTLALGTRGRGLHRGAKVGELLSFRVSGNDVGGGSVNRVVPMIREARGVGERT